MEIQKEQWSKQKEELQATNEMLRQGANLEAEPELLQEKERHRHLLEKIEELMDTVVKSERLLVKYKQELQRTGQALEEECKRNESLKSEMLKYRSVAIQFHKQQAHKEIEHQIKQKLSR